MLRVVQAGVQATLQGSPRLGVRHLGIPYAGPADAVSMSLANRLVENPKESTAIEITYGGFIAEAEAACSIAITGAPVTITISGQTAPCHETVHIQRGERIEIGAPKTGLRNYLAIASGFQADDAFGSSSTYLPAEFGGVNGRALIAGDVLKPLTDTLSETTVRTPEELRPAMTGVWGVRACIGAETSLIDQESFQRLFEASFTVGRQVTRMGVALEGQTLTLNSDGKMKSAPVFPGTIQCPPSGVPIALLADAQTTGGYPRIASIARCDRHLLGQARPGDLVRLLHRSPEAALKDYHEKTALLAGWLDR